MIPLCADQGVGLIPWSPQARGRLARPRGAETARAATDKFARKIYEATKHVDAGVIDTVEELAAERGVGMAQVALAWVLSKPEVSAPIVGATRPEHLDDAVAAIDLALSEDETRRLEEHYLPHAITGHD